MATWSSIIQPVHSGPPAPIEAMLTCLAMQTDGNLVLYGPSGSRWASNTWSPANKLVMQDDGNLVMYGPTGPFGRPTPLIAALSLIV